MKPTQATMGLKRGTSWVETYSENHSMIQQFLNTNISKYSPKPKEQEICLASKVQPHKLTKQFQKVHLRFNKQ